MTVEQADLIYSDLPKSVVSFASAKGWPPERSYLFNTPRYGIAIETDFVEVRRKFSLKPQTSVGRERRIML